MTKYTKRVIGFKTYAAMQEYIKRNKIKPTEWGHSKTEKHFFEYK